MWSLHDSALRWMRCVLLSWVSVEPGRGQGVLVGVLVLVLGGVLVLGVLVLKLVRIGAERLNQAVRKYGQG